MNSSCLIEHGTECIKCTVGCVLSNECGLINNTHCQMRNTDTSRSARCPFGYMMNEETTQCEEQTNECLYTVNNKCYYCKSSTLNSDQTCGITMKQTVNEKYSLLTNRGCVKCEDGFYLFGKQCQSIKIKTER